MAVAVASRILVTGSGVSVLTDTGEVLVDLPFSTDGATAAAELTLVVGADPVVSTQAGDSECVDAGTTYDWGSFQIDSPVGFFSEPGAAYSIHVYEPATGNGLALELAPNVRSGSSIAEMLAAAPGTLDTWVVDFGKWLVDPTVDGRYGVVVNEYPDGSVFSFGAPIKYFGRSGC